MKRALKTAEEACQHAELRSRRAAFAVEDAKAALDASLEEQKIVCGLDARMAGTKHESLIKDLQQDWAEYWQHLLSSANG